MTRSEIVAEAESWIGTKYQHQASLKGVACDCIGLIRGVYEHFNGSVGVISNYSPHWHMFNADENLYTELQKYNVYQIPSEQVQPGDILLFNFGKWPAHHAGIMLDNGIFVHSYAQAKKVTTNTFAGRWQGYLHSVFCFGGVVDG